MSYSLEARNPCSSKRNMLVNNGSFHSILDLTGMGDLCRDTITEHEAHEMADRLEWVVEFIEFARKSGGFRIG